MKLSKLIEAIGDREIHTLGFEKDFVIFDGPNPLYNMTIEEKVKYYEERGNRVEYHTLKYYVPSVMLARRFLRNHIEYVEVADKLNENNIELVVKDAKYGAVDIYCKAGQVVHDPNGGQSYVFFEDRSRSFIFDIKLSPDVVSQFQS